MLAWLPLLVAYSAYRPGIMSADSLKMWGEARAGVISDFSSALYGAAALTAYRATGTPSIITLTQSLLLASSVVAVGYSLRRLAVPTRWIVLASVALMVTPMVGAFSVSLWKDIPYAAFYLLLAAATLRVVAAWMENDEAALRHGTWLMAGAAFAAMLLRQNGVFLIAATFAILAVGLPGVRRHLLLALLATLVAYGGTKALLYPALGVVEPPGYATAGTLVHDIASVVAGTPSQLIRTTWTGSTPSAMSAFGRPTTTAVPSDRCTTTPACRWIPPASMSRALSLSGDTSSWSILSQFFATEDARPHMRGDRMRQHRTSTPSALESIRTNWALPHGRLRRACAAPTSTRSDGPTTPIATGTCGEHPSGST